ncbi:MAG: hypothetical protein NZM33_04620 [Bryobacteraceae bacterium]|nr:hypothetical protein [Bryobacteraceae bacterium]
MTERGRADYERLMASGLYGELSRDGLLIRHREEASPAPGIWKLLVPEQLEFVSYPYEWCFSQLKDAALLTLEIQQRALERGLSLKDASPFNVQFRLTRPQFIDTLSFEVDDGGPWIAYEQFCREFLGPLFACLRFPGAVQHLRVRPDGFDLEAVWNSLPWRARLRPGAILHIYLHARARKGLPRTHGVAKPRPGTKSLVAASLRRTVERLRVPARPIVPDAELEPPQSLKWKHEMVRAVFLETGPRTVLGLGAGTLPYARQAARWGSQVILYDANPDLVESVYREERAAGNGRLLPLVVDLRNPTPALGFALSERQSLLERARADLVLAMSSVWELCLRQAIPFGLLAEFLAKLGRHVLIEFAPPTDPLVGPMLARLGAAVENYSREEFVSAFRRRFRLLKETWLPGTERRLMLFAA